MTHNTPNPEALDEEQQLRNFISYLEEIKTMFRSAELPNYLTDEQREEWRKILARDERDMGLTIDKAAIELDKEEWYER
jgi:hypothetical protein